MKRCILGFMLASLSTIGWAAEDHAAAAERLDREYQQFLYGGL
jgi:hypothetical protein